MATTLKFLILGDDQASRAFDKFARSVDNANRSVDKQTTTLKKQEAESGKLSKTVDSLAGSMSGLASPMGAAVIAGAALAPVAVTLGAGLGGLGLAALSASKHTQAMNTILGPLKTEIRDFQNSLQPQVFTLFGDGAGIAKDALHQLQPVAAATGNALHGVLGQVGAELRSGEWRQFFQFMAAQAGPDLQLVGKLLVDVVKDIPPLLEQLQPAARLLLLLADGALKAVGGLEKMHAVLPLLGAAIGFVIGGAEGGPLGALIGGLSGLVFQEFAAARATKGLAEEFAAVAQVKFPSSAAVNTNWAAVAKAVGSAGSSAGSAAAFVTDVKNAMIDAHPAVGTIRGDMDLLNAAIVSGNTQLAAYADLWDKFVGRSVSYQQAVLNIKQAFEGYASAVKTSGRTSTAAQQAFLGIFTTMQSGLQTLQQNGASVQQVNDFYKTNIARLSALHGLTPQQRADVQGLTKDYTAWASATQGLPPKILAAAGALRDTLLAQLANGHRLVPSVKSDMDAFSDAVLKTGTKSRATAADRATLIKDLEKSGFSAQAAQGLVRDFQGQIDRLHGKTVDVNLSTSGSGSIIITGTGINTRRIDTTTGTLRGPGGHAAAGLYITHGRPGVDDQLIAAQLGELVVPTAMVNAGEVDHLRGRIPGFAAGGVVGKVSGAETAAGGAEAAFGSLAAAAFAQSALKAVQAIASTGFLGAGFGSYAADIQAVLRAMGLPLSLTANWLRQIQTESGGNLNAVNLTDSNAQAGHPSVGLLQLIPSTFAAYAGPYLRTPPLVNYGGGYVSLDPMAQIYAAIHYAWARYDGAMASVIGQGHGYDSGGYLPTGWSLAYNGTGRPEPVTPAGRMGGNTYNITVNVSAGTHPAQAGKAVVQAIREYEKTSGTGWRRTP